MRDASAVLVVGTNAEHAARVALGIARAESDRRHVALGDLTGDAAPLYAVAGGEDAFGLSDCLRQGLPLNDIARPAPDRESLFILPAGSPPVACEEILAHERWPRLVNGFTKVGALLVLVAPPDAPGLESLAAVTGGVVLVDDAAPCDAEPPRARPRDRAPRRRRFRHPRAQPRGAGANAGSLRGSAMTIARAGNRRRSVEPAGTHRARVPADRRESHDRGRGRCVPAGPAAAPPASGHCAAHRSCQPRGHVRHRRPSRWK